MQDTIREAKRTLREQVRAEMRKIPSGRRATASAQARALLEAQTAWERAKSVMLFAPLPEELDVWPLLTAALAGGKRVALPRFVTPTQGYEAYEVLDPATDLETGRFGIREPGARCARFASERLDLILVPGVAFDLQGRRLGRGKGYYDQLLAALLGTKCGVAFDEQIVSEIPVEPHDAPLDCILTPTRWIELRA
jgi:5-formyltetrahydrofolate cyclo-ligase